MGPIHPAHKKNAKCKIAPHFPRLEDDVRVNYTQRLRRDSYNRVFQVVM